MNWYYTDGQKRVGPVTEYEIGQLAAQGKIGPDTLVWNELISKWQPYGQMRGGESTTSETALPLNEPTKSRGDSGAQSTFGPAEEKKMSACVECGRVFPDEEMLRYEDSMICASCKPAFFQKLKEGAVMPASMEYGGFWIRFGAKIIDGIIMGLVNSVLTFMLFLLFGLSFLTFDPKERMSGTYFAAQGISSVLQLVLQATYVTFFLGKYAATPGKMACGLKVVMADGEKVSYSRALARHLAEYLSAIILMIGYIMAAFDEEKRALHDRICNTRVIKK
ncbi:MAG TPA: RDD family protein [Thermodesulfovibrionales bacterium]|nr:RDD family protein [Thermodesulfovibrionales bacterium]